MSKGWKITVIALGVIVLIPLIGAWVRRGQEQGCAFDGERIKPIYRVRIVDEEDRSHVFCSVDCAGHWLDRRKARAKEILVTDEHSGQEIPASIAFFVRSSIITMPVSGNRVHVFKSRSEAETHARVWKGPILNSLDVFHFPGSPP